MRKPSRSGAEQYFVLGFTISDLRTSAMLAAGVGRGGMPRSLSKNFLDPRKRGDARHASYDWHLRLDHGGQGSTDTMAWPYCLHRALGLAVPTVSVHCKSETLKHLKDFVVVGARTSWMDCPGLTKKVPTGPGKSRASSMLVLSQLRRWRASTD